jgi:hypothetical protein
MLSLVICGIEHSGTTLVSDVFRQVPGLDAGFECGVLLCETPRAFPDRQPFFGNMLQGWGIDEVSLRECCDTDDFDEFYARLAARSSVLGQEVTRIFDKTPRYLLQLPACLGRMNVPFICTYKDPRAVVYSDFMRAKPDSFDIWYEPYRTAKKRYMRELYSQMTARQEDRHGRVLSVSLEDLCLNARHILERMFAHVRLPFSLDYVLIEKRRYAHNRENTISAGVAFQYRRGLSKAQLSQIERDFSPFAAWFYD